ncbi:Mpo1-like protein [Mucilaginibacter sp. cycad4]|uniref:Mpo1 family 2-hydroxy fatty acid dioxygenase n=1 Tax=Mucilaginibacter sp. cycad4 TaxID=3342096 RepID=UPI002AABA9F3|nr:Mpo1-like protein [Mucilaginibacter gossypii]WPU99853.1 Mpo1-like protein [Mucilaginibacter gossypii]
MATKTNNKQKSTGKTTANIDERPIDRYFREYAEAHQDKVNQIVHYICIPTLAFSVFGLIWSIPFPHLAFLGIYNGYFNWASFVIAIAIYFYLKLSPIISYFILFILLGFSYGIMELVAWQQAGGPAMWSLCISIFIPSLSAVLIGNSREPLYAKNGLNIRSLVVAPAYLLNQLLNKLRIKS